METILMIMLFLVSSAIFLFSVILFLLCFLLIISSKLDLMEWKKSKKNKTDIN